MTEQKEPVSCAERIRRMFGQWVHPGQHSMLFDNLPIDIRERLLRAAGIATGERPLVACYFDKEAWTLLTAERLIWRRAGKEVRLSWYEIADINVDQQPVRPHHPGGASAHSQLCIVTRSGATHGLEWESGPPFFGIWSALKMVARQQSPED